MDLIEWAKTEEFTAIWKESFVKGMDMLGGHAQGAGFSKTDHKKGLAHWLLLHEPLPGFRLIAVEFPFRNGPPRLYLRVWAYQPEGDAPFKALEAERFVHGGHPLPPVAEWPQAGWKRSLKGVAIRGLTHMVELTPLESLTPAAVGPALREIAAAFCHYVVNVCVPTAAAIAHIAPQIAPPLGESGNSAAPETATRPPVSDAAGETEETLAALAADLAAIETDPRFEDLTPSERVTGKHPSTTVLDDDRRSAVVMQEGVMELAC